MDNTFDVGRDFPKLSAAIRVTEARRKRMSRLTFLISVAINLAICGVLLYSDINDLVCLLIVAWVSFSSVFPVRIMLERLIK